MNYVHKTNVNGKLVTFTHLGSQTLPSFNQVTSVTAIPFTRDGRLVVVNLRHRGLDFPGGHVEPYESNPEQTMRREVMEEAYMTIREPVLVDVVSSDYFDDKTSYMLLYGVYVDEFQDFIPNEESSERILLSPDEFLERFTAWDKDAIKADIELAWKLLQK